LEIIRQLLLRAGEVVSKGELLEAVWPRGNGLSVKAGSARLRSIGQTPIAMHGWRCPSVAGVRRIAIGSAVR
jgi:hypothetical protein